MPTEHFSFRMKTDENRLIITREFIHSVGGGGTLILCVHTCHSSTYQALSHILKSMYALYKCHVTCAYQCVAAFIYTLIHADTNLSASELDEL